MARDENRRLQEAHCLACRNVFRAWPHDLKHRNRKFCSLKCRNTGQFNPSYKGSAKTAYQRKEESIARHWEKHLCRKRFKYAFDKGRIARLPCHFCAAIETEAHHSDYSKPLSVVWLCRQHHVDVHAGKSILPPIPLLVASKAA
jgi:hypothetical protein